jgi:hypothetical protein
LFAKAHCRFVKEHSGFGKTSFSLKRLADCLTLLHAGVFFAWTAGILDQKNFSLAKRGGATVAMAGEGPSPHPKPMSPLTGLFTLANGFYK